MLDIGLRLYFSYIRSCFLIDDIIEFLLDYFDNLLIELEVGVCGWSMWVNFMNLIVLLFLFLMFFS